MKNILVFPGKSYKKNTHLHLLYNVLLKNGYKVYPFSMMKLIKLRFVAIVHIHWTDLFHKNTIYPFGNRIESNILPFFRIGYFFCLMSVFKLFRVKIIWSIHNVVSHNMKESLGEKIVNKLLLRYSDRVTAFNNYIKDSIVAEYGTRKKIYLMRQGIYEGLYPPVTTKNKACKLLGVDPDNFVLLLFGGIAPYKGIDILISALKEYNNEDIRLIIAGSAHADPDYGNIIENMANEDKRILFVNELIPEEQLTLYFSAADYTIYPYRDISNSGVLFLTITMGVPTIIADKGGVKEVLALESDCGILLSDVTKQEIIKAIKKAQTIERPESAIKRLQEKLRWKNMEKEILSVFQFKKQS